MLPDKFLLKSPIWSSSHLTLNTNEKKTDFDKYGDRVSAAYPNNDFDYEIPKWVYKNVFKHNKPTKRIKESDYYYLFRNPKL